MRIKFEEAQSSFDKAIDFLKSELSAIRAGRANPGMFENIEVEAYGQKMPLNQVANINIVDATLVTLQVWDKSIVAAVEKAIQQSNLGINPSVDGELVRLPLPALTEERRKEYVKTMKQQVEEARITIRQIRKDILVGLDEDKDNKVFSEDEYHAKTKQLQEKVDAANEQIEEIATQKESELMQV